jgi:hypothetical protein
LLFDSLTLIGLAFFRRRPVLTPFAGLTFFVRPDSEEFRLQTGLKYFYDSVTKFIQIFETTFGKQKESISFTTPKNFILQSAIEDINSFLGKLLPHHHSPSFSSFPWQNWRVSPPVEDHTNSTDSWHFRIIAPFT